MACTFHASRPLGPLRWISWMAVASCLWLAAGPSLVPSSRPPPSPLPLRSAEDVPTCLVCVCRRLPSSVAVCRGHQGWHPWFVGPFREHRNRGALHLHTQRSSSPSPRARVAKRSAGREDGEVTEPPRGVGPEAGDNARAQWGSAGREDGEVTEPPRGVGLGFRV